MSDLDNVLERTVVIRALRSTVFRHLTDSGRFAAWWGAGSRIDPRPGGDVHIRYPNGAVATGAVVEIDEPERVVFTFGYEGEGKPLAPGASLVTITLEEVPEGTLLRLRHAFAEAAVRDMHIQGWRYQLAVFSVVAARAQHGDPGSLVDRFFGAWSETDTARRRSTLEEIAAPALSFRDAYSATDGIADLVEHISASQQFMPGMRLERRGEVKHCQGTAVADWVAVAADGSERGRGCNVIELAPDGRIVRVVGLWSP
jgi:uncharacterized protein YndB with AHSA1/START domain